MQSFITNFKYIVLLLVIFIVCLSSNYHSPFASVQNERQPVMFEQTRVSLIAESPLLMEQNLRTVRWINPVGGDFRVAANWEGGIVPGQNDIAVIDLPGSYTVVLVNGAPSTVLGGLIVGGATGIQTLQVDLSITINGEAVIEKNGRLELDYLFGTGNLTVKGVFNWRAGITGGMYGSGSTTVAAGGMLIINDNLTLDRTLNNAGTVVLRGDNFFSGNKGNIIPINNQLGGLFILESDGAISGCCYITINNAGTMRKIGDTRTELSTNVNNSGSIEVTTGRLSITGVLDNTGAINVAAGQLDIAGGKSTGSIQVATNSIINFYNYNFTVSSGGSLTGQGLIRLSDLVFFGIPIGGSLTIDVGAICSMTQWEITGHSILDLNVDINPENFLFSGGYIKGNGNIRPANSFDWSGGDMFGSGKTIIPATSRLTISGTTGKGLGRTIDNQGLIVMNGIGLSGSGDITIINNLAGGRFEIQGDSSLFIDNGFGGSVGTFNNFGSFSASGLVTATGCTFNNNGTINVPKVFNLSKFNQTATGLLNIEIGNSMSGDYDQIKANDMSLAGTLNLSLINNFTPMLGQTFSVLKFFSQQGSFNRINNLSLGNGLRLEGMFTTDSYNLSVVQVQPKLVPSRGGDNGSITVTIYGDGFIEGLQAKLTRANTVDIPAMRIIYENDGLVKVTFDLTSKLRGIYNTVLINPNGSTIAIPNSFTIEVGKTLKPEIVILGSTAIRLAREQTYSVIISNPGNTDMYGVPINISFPNYAIFIRNFELIAPTQFEDELINYNQVPIGGKLISGATVVPLIFPLLEAGNRKTIQFKLKIPETITLGGRFDVTASVGDPILGNRLVDLNKVGNRTSYLESVDNCSLAVGKALLDCLPNLIPGGGCVKGFAEFYADAIVDYVTDPKGAEAPAAVNWTAVKFVKTIAKCIGVVVPVANLIGLIDCLTNGADAYSACQKELNKSVLSVNVVNSFDPNEKYGPSGIGAEHFISNDQLLSYLITFENIATASAPAQEVFVVDQLDLTRFDVNTFQFGPLGFADKTNIVPPVGFDEFTTDLDLRPAKELIVRITGNFNRTTGLITWKFSSLDPVTMQLTEDPLLGFLDPNTTPPVGEGMVSFTIKSKAGLANGVRLTNRASITFDINAPMATSEVFNTIDTRKPVITSFSPSSGSIGTTFNINGSNFIGTTRVSFTGGANAAFNINSATSITATVPQGAMTGPIIVTNQIGATTSTINFNLLPKINSFTPSSGGSGTTVVISGSNFTGVTTIKFNNLSASFNVNSDSQITATVPVNATSGLIGLTAPAGTVFSATPFTILAAPRITSFTPASGPVGSQVNLTGTNFVGVTAVKFNGIDAQFSVQSNTSIIATVPANVTSGKISAISPTGTATSTANFNIQPKILSFTPSSGIASTQVTILGTSFTGANLVKFGATIASFTLNSDSQVIATVPANAITGAITLVTPGGTAMSATPFTVLKPPVITSFTPTSAAIGSIITINGNNLTGTTDIKFNGVSSTDFQVISNTQIKATVPITTSGKISIINPIGNAISTAIFSVLPRIIDFTPKSGLVGSNVTIFGNGFNSVTMVKFGNAIASFTINSDNQITAIVPVNSVKSNIFLVTAKGIVISLESFTVISIPKITSFTPTSGKVGAVVTINGTNLFGVTEVKFNATVAVNYTIVSGNQIKVALPIGATTGKISVTNPAGNAVSSASFTVLK